MNDFISIKGDKHINDFAATWQNETEATMRTLETLTDESLGQL